MNKTCLITGATDGIGKQTALVLAQKGFSLVLVGRSAEKGNLVVSELISATGNESIHFHCADLSNMKSIQQLSVEIKQNYSAIDILINNAGAYVSKLTMTDEGFEKTFALNHLAYFHFTELLLEMVKEDIPGRIINVASMAHKNAKIDFNNLQMENEYKGWTAYSRSKLMNIMFTYECHRRYSDTGVSFNCLHPGFVKSKFGDNNKGFAKTSISLAKTIFAINLVKGAKTSIYLASSKDVDGVSGKYFDKCKVATSSKVSYIQEDQKKLWEATDQIIKKTYVLG
ncbi:MAG: SDR family oxidoreductase [Candidatus Marinimicrobia bacterium]|jgi:NAD(P)-dependent dehydrogenase (short-subunit alcohol dehydrogenase family)|nr:SDR family oxidoreductase [Candidatus Neomarinimicrobiota bacterium]MBT3839006.1 SDR family oxidoreductase [Candidatus Neomarinimicrobiota bacterium]MBT3999319.1 SDR family oxidoreductase [Candidatus Neomarinimicrobiota bacterium]MBT4282729.1 SDR family oxidoreductase [Candidatus Neomarinimicrobiota bacterium]MBT4578293.1 SDR family oxidoreductase [Candidatus Neomarinimicrobiota bacterium]